MAWFSHCGDLGDIIYSLPAIRAAGGGDLYLFSDLSKTTHPMTQQRVDLLRPLLLLQPYVREVRFWNSDEARDHSLNRWRAVAGGQTIADMHLLALGYSPAERNMAWLTVDYAIDAPPVLFHRSGRYHNAHFPWKRVWAAYARRAAFVGLPAEHEEFCREVGYVPYLPTGNLCELARHIAGSKLFVGNQSAPYAIAEGLKASAILEVSPDYPNCCFARAGVIHGRDDSIVLPTFT